MKYILYLLILIGPGSVFAQSWYDDTDGTGFPIAGGLQHGTLVNGKANAADKSIALSVFSRINSWSSKDKPSRVDPNGQPPGINEERPAIADLMGDGPTIWGWGASVKGKAENGLSSLFSTGTFTPSTTLSGYLTRTKYKDICWKDSCLTTLRNWLVGVRYTNSSYRFADLSQPFDQQLGEPTAFNGLAFSVAHNFIRPFKPDINKDGIDASWFGGVSLSLEHKNNYATLSTAEIKTSRIGLNKENGDTLRVATIEDEDGYSYAVPTAEKPYKTFWNVRVQGNIGLIPAGARVSLRLYPSVVLRDSKAICNLGLGAYFLKEGEPTISIAGLFFELNDLGNSGGSKDPFLKRTFTLGLVASLNILTGESRTE